MGGNAAAVAEVGQLAAVDVDIDSAVEGLAVALVMSSEREVETVSPYAHHGSEKRGGILLQVMLWWMNPCS